MNTGIKIYQFLKEIVISTGSPTGVVKANVIGDPDYVAPVTDYIKCPIITWQAINPSCVTVPQCQPGWVLTNDGNVCQFTQTQAAIPPTDDSSPGTIAKVDNIQWNTGGARVFDPGYGSNGSGVVAATLLVPHFWINGTLPFNGAGDRNATDGRMNATAIWDLAGVSDGSPFNEYIGCVRKVTLTEAATYYVGMAGDNAIRIIINGVTVVDAININSGANWNFWNIYPVDLIVGDNYIEMFGMNQSSAAGFGAEIYNNTLAELEAATSPSDLNIIFSTASLVGEPFDLGITQGYSCPSGWSLDPNGGSPICVLISNESPSSVRTGMKAFLQRARLTSGILDGYIEDNLDGSGIGPYFAPVQDLINCSI